MRNIFAIILILGAIGIYYGYTKHVFADIKDIKVQLANYKDTLNKANELSEEQQQLTDLMNSFNQADREKLDKLIPDNADNVRLILDIQNIAQGSGLSIKNIKINENNAQGSQSDPVADAESISNGNSNEKYNFITLSFTVTSTYSNYVPFVKKLEQSLRLVDITALSIKPGSAPGLYDFDMTLRAYWLK